MRRTFPALHQCSSFDSMKCTSFFFFFFPALASSGPTDGKYAGRVWCRALIRGQQSFASGLSMASRRVPQSYQPQGSTGDSRLRSPADSLTDDKGDLVEQRATLEPEPFPKTLRLRDAFVLLSSSNFRFISRRHDSACRPHEWKAASSPTAFSEA